MFRAFLRPSSGELTVLELLHMVFSTGYCCSLGEWVVSRVHCEEDVARATSSPQCTRLTTYLKLMKILPVAAELFHAEGLTDGRTEK
jgi:hypothetical protein